MKDFDYEVKERKKIANQAKYRKNGRKSKKCSLPSDSLTPAQIKKMNGECKVYKIGQPISFNEFKSYPVEMQIKYLEWMRDNLGANRQMIVETLGISNGYIYTYAKSALGRTDLWRRQATEQNKKLFRKWLKGSTNAVVKEQPKQEEKKPIEKADKMVIPVFNVISCGELHLSGSAAEIGQTIWRIFGEARLEMDITFSVEQKKEEPLDVKDEPTSIEVTSEDAVNERFE